MFRALAVPLSLLLPVWCALSETEKGPSLFAGSCRNDRRPPMTLFHLSSCLHRASIANIHSPLTPYQSGAKLKPMMTKRSASAKGSARCFFIKIFETKDRRKTLIGHGEHNWHSKPVWSVHGCGCGCVCACACACAISALMLCSCCLMGHNNIDENGRRKATKQGAHPLCGGFVSHFRRKPAKWTIRQKCGEAIMPPVRNALRRRA